jgi:16S rRNA (cytosine1402-N4)-methyltransferase
LRVPSYHTPVLREEVLEYLLTATDGVYVDATLGGGGHTEAILERLSPAGRVIGFDADRDAIEFATERLAGFASQVEFVNENFTNLENVLAHKGVAGVHGIVFDLGVSSYQLDEPSKGFSFQGNERLDMRMNRSQPLDAYEVVNRYSERDLADVLWKYGEEHKARAIARAIVRHRTKRHIETTGELTTIIHNVIGERFVIKTLARVFQALRIEVNNELEHLQQALQQAITVLYTGGRLVVISYHSLEDRIVKNTFKEAAATSRPSGNKLIPDITLHPTLKIVTKKPVKASEAEQRLNPRSRSAKLRATERI